MYSNMSLNSQYFSPGAGSNVHKTDFYFLKLTKKYFISWSFSFNIDENEVCTKKIDRIFNKINTHSPSYIKKWASFAWLINYFAVGNLLCDQIIMYHKNFSEKKSWRKWKL